MSNLIKYVCIVLLFVNCGNPMPPKDKIVGIWRSNDGVIIELKKNHSAKIINYPLSLSNSDFKGIVTGTGTWKIYKDKSVSWWTIEISITTNKIIPELYSKRIALDLFITQSGLTGDGENITSLFIWKGDPDLDDRYEFKKE